MPFVQDMTLTRKNIQIYIMERHIPNNAASFT